MIQKKVIAHGAEAIICIEKENKTSNLTILKNRVPKAYRSPYLDLKLRKSRTRREAKVLQKLFSSDFPCPQLISSDDKEMTISMQFIKGKLVKDVLDQRSTDCNKLCRQIGVLIARMHSIGIIHADLTTSNMMFHPDELRFNSLISFIDFGLSYFSTKNEDMAVDLHLFKQALASKHYKIAEECTSAALKGYNSTQWDNSTSVLNRLKIVESRGRYKDRKIMKT